MRPSFNSTSERPLSFDPKNMVFAGAIKKGPGLKKLSEVSLKGATGTNPQTPMILKESASVRQRGKEKTPPEALP